MFRDSKGFWAEKGIASIENTPETVDQDWLSLGATDKGVYRRVDLDLETGEIEETVEVIE